MSSFSNLFESDTIILFKFLVGKQRYDFNFNRVAVNILLYPSVCFTIKQLHRDNALHNSGGIRLKVVVNKLVDSDILTVCPHGIKNSSKRTPVYIKQLPPEDESDQESYLVTALSEYTKDNQPLSFSAYKRSCNSFFLVTDGIIHDDVYQILGRPEYDTRDFFHLFHSQNPVDLQSPPPTDLDSKQVYYMLLINRFIFTICSRR